MMAQAHGRLRFSNHPLAAVNDRDFEQAKGQPMVADHPHYENGTYHLYFCTVLGKWCLNSQFTPDLRQGFATVQADTNGGVPQGKNPWHCYVDNEWTDHDVHIEPLDAKSVLGEDSCIDIVVSLLADAADSKRFLKSNPIAAIEAACTQKKALFVDSYFPPGNDALNHDNSVQDANAVVEWVRFSTLHRKTFLFDDSIGDDVHQGTIGDCYMCATFAGVASVRPDLLEKVFASNGASSPSGCYALRLCDPRSGEWRYVLVDDWVPTRRGQPCFLHSKTKGEMWCSLLEKAFAKLAGSFASLDAGRKDGLPDLVLPKSAPGAKSITRIGEIMEMLSGSIGHSFFVNTATVDEQVVWDLLKVFMAHKWIVAAGCNPRHIPGKNLAASKKKKDAEGLVYHHEYSVLGCVEMPGNEKLVRIRNPWGHFEWNGKWADSDKAWTKQAKAYLAKSKTGGGPLVNADDGMSFLPFKDFFLNFDTVTFCPVVGDAVWAEWQLVKQKAMEAQAVEGLRFSGFPIAMVNGHVFKQSKDQPFADGCPHFENGHYHLAYSHNLGKWSLSTPPFVPGSTSGYGTILPTARGTVPVGMHVWNCYNKGKWEDIPGIKVEALSAQAVPAKGKADDKKIAMIQAHGALRFLDHPLAAVNGHYFKQAKDQPMVDGHPHYANGTYHLIFVAAAGKWYLQRLFKPGQSRGLSATLPNEYGGVPEGRHSWHCYVEKKWVDVHITVKNLS